MIRQEDDLVFVETPSNSLPILPVHLRPEYQTLVKTKDDHVIQINTDGTMRVIQWPIIKFTFQLHQPLWRTK